MSAFGGKAEVIHLTVFCYHSSMLHLVLTLVLPLPMTVAMADLTGIPRIVDGGTLQLGETKIRLHCFFIILWSSPAFV